jgi:hypothetical protein
MPHLDDVLFFWHCGLLPFIAESLLVFGEFAICLFEEIV